MAALVAALVLGLYFWAFFSSDAGASLEESLLVSDLVAISAGVTLLISGVLWLFAPHRDKLLIAPLAVYLSLAATTALLVVESSGAESPYVALWILTAVFAAIFGIYGIAPMFLAASTYIAIVLIDGDYTNGQLMLSVLLGILPVTISILLWNKADENINRTEKNPVDYKQPSHELNELADQSEPIINAIGDGVIAIDAHGVVQLINPAAQEILGWRKQDAISLDYRSVFRLIEEDGSEITATTDPVQQVLNSNQQERSKDLRVSSKNGKKLNVAVVVSPIGQAGSGSIIVFRDVTKEIAEGREQAEFISTASHEMRTPVASIEGYLGLALNPSTAQVDDKAREFIGKAQDSAKHLGRLFQDLLDVSRADDGRLSNNPKVTDIVEFTGEVVEGLRPKAEEKGLSLQYKPGASNGQGDRKLSPVYFVNLDRDHIREIINNLTENAIKYTPAGEVSVDIRGDDEHVRISIKDSGIGIPSEDIPHLFQKFYRVDNSDTREIGGTGLGLYLCRRLAENLGGRIWADSTYKQGSTFYLELPRIDRAEAERLQQDITPSNATTSVEQASQIFEQPAEPTRRPVAVPAPAEQPQPEAPTIELAAPEPEPTPVPQAVPQRVEPIPQQEATPQMAPTPVIEAAPQPAAPQPYIQPQPEQVSAPVPQATPLAQPTAPAEQKNNTPLDQIENSPNAYRETRTEGRVNIPPRR